MKFDDAYKAIEAAFSGNRQRLIEAVEAMERGEAAANRHVTAKRLRRLIDRNSSRDSCQVIHLPNDQNLRGASARPSRVRLSDLILAPEAEAALRQLKREHECRDVLEANGLHPRNRLLFVGPPGNGKTSSAEALAGHLELPFVRVEHSQVVDSYMGVTSREIVEMFRSTSFPCVLFIDECDALFQSRTSGGEGDRAGQETNRITTQLLMSIDDLAPCVTLVAATNRVDVLDAAIRRRFQSEIEFPPPTREGIASHVERLRKRMPALANFTIPISIESFAHLQTACENHVRSVVAA